MEKYDAVVIGAGNGGLTCAVSSPKWASTPFCWKGTTSPEAAPRAFAGGVSNSKWRSTS